MRGKSERTKKRSSFKTMGYLCCPTETRLLLKEKKGGKKKENVEDLKRTRLERFVPYFYMRYYPIAIDVVC